MKASAPRSDLKHPEFLSLILSFRMPRSEALIKHRFTVGQRIPAPVTAFGAFFNDGIHDITHGKRAAFVSRLPTGLLAGWLAQGFCATDHLVFQGFLGGRCVTVAGVLRRLFVSGEMPAEFFILLVFLLKKAFQVAGFLELPLTCTVNLADSRMLRIDGLLHRFNLCGQSAKHFCYVINLLFHRYKGTKNIGHAQMYLHLILMEINKLSEARAY